jgi:hypothetical protein
MLEVSLTVIALGALVLVRNNLVYRASVRRIDEVHQRNLVAINEGWMREEFFHEYDDEVRYEIQILDLRKWTYKQFYPTPVAWRT